MKILTKLAQGNRHRWYAVGAFVLVFGLAGTYLLVLSRAVTPTASIQAEVGTLTSNVAAVTDTTASASQAAKFGQTVVTTGPPCGRTTTRPATYKHVIFILEENKSYSEVIGNSNAPYENTLVQQCANATNYQDIVHPSSGNYIALTSGQVPPVLNGDPLPSSTASTTIDNIFRQVRTAGGKAFSYEEDMPSNCDMTDFNLYRPKHNPQVYYRATADLAACQTDNVPMGTTTGGAFLSALASDTTLPAFSFVTPNEYNDMHDRPVSTGDAWLQSWLPIVFNSPSYKLGNTAVFILWDETNSTLGGTQPGIFIAPSIQPGTVLTTSINHYNVLRTTEEMLGIPSYLAGAGTASSMRTGLNL